MHVWMSVVSVTCRRGGVQGGPGVRTPPAAAKTTCEIRVNPVSLTYGVWGGGLTAKSQVSSVQGVSIEQDNRAS